MNEEKVQKEEESSDELIVTKLLIGAVSWDVAGIVALDPPEEDTYYWAVEYKDGTQIFTTEPVTVVYSKQPQDAVVVNIGKGLKSIKQ